MSGRWIVAAKGIVVSKVTTKERVLSSMSGSSTETGSALVSHTGRLWVAWVGTDRRINLMSSADGVTFDQKVVLDERSSAQPALTVHGGRLVLSWTGGGNKINVATVAV
jgi:hypothetical protein